MPLKQRKKPTTPDEEQLYLFVDKSGHCFKDFQKMGDIDDGSRRYNNHVGAFMRGGCKFSVGDMLAFRDDFLAAGFKWGRDFYVKKC